MNKIKKIERIKRRWEATELLLRDRGMPGKAGVIMRRIEGIDAALEILNQPSNTQMHVDKEPCAECEKEKKNYPWPPFCKWCGRALSQ